MTSIIDVPEPWVLTPYVSGVTCNMHYELYLKTSHLHHYMIFCRNFSISDTTDDLADLIYDLTVRLYPFTQNVISHNSLKQKTTELSNYLASDAFKAKVKLDKRNLGFYQ